MSCRPPSGSAWSPRYPAPAAPDRAMGRHHWRELCRVLRNLPRRHAL